MNDTSIKDYAESLLDVLGRIAVTLEALDPMRPRMTTPDALLALLQALERVERRCLYCTFGKDADVSVEDLRQHIECECEHHPLRALRADLRAVAKALEQSHACATFVIEIDADGGVHGKCDGCYINAALARPGVRAALKETP